MLNANAVTCDGQHIGVHAGAGHCYALSNLFFQRDRRFCRVVRRASDQAKIISRRNSYTDFRTGKHLSNCLLEVGLTEKGEIGTGGYTITAPDGTLLQTSNGEQPFVTGVPSIVVQGVTS